MIRYGIQVHVSRAGWATVHLDTEDRGLDIRCSDLGGDCIGQLARAFVQLLGDAHGKVEADCCGEPENALIKLQRDESELEVAVKRYHWEGDCAPQDVVHRAIKSGKIRDWDELRQARNKKVALRQFGPFVEAIRSLVQSFQYLEDRIGSKQYEGK